MAKPRIAKTNPTKKQLIRHLTENGGYQESDDFTIDLYVETEESYLKMLKELRDSPYLGEHTNKFGATNITRNPLLTEINKTVQLLSNLLKSMGLTPGQRKSMTPSDGGDEFDKF